MKWLILPFPWVLEESMCWDCVRKGPPDYIKRENQYTEAERVLVRCSAVLVCDNSTLTLETSAVAVQSQHAWMCVWGLRCYCGNLGYAVLGMNSGRLTLIDFMVCFGLFSELRLWQFHFASFTFFFLIFPWWQQCSICEFGNSAAIKKWFQISPSHSRSCVLFVICRLDSL